jgi:MerR family transcriptional regulator, mercuric resistance operon regulatory protein
MANDQRRGGPGHGPAGARAGAELSVGQLASRAGVRADTIRFYERTGLLPRPARTEGDHRRYGPGDLDRLLFIRGAQRLGLRLAEIRQLTELRETGICPCGPAETLLRQHVTEVDREIARLTALRAQLTGMVDGLAGPSPCPDPVPGTWQPPGRRAPAEAGADRSRPARLTARGGDADVLMLR